MEAAEIKRRFVDGEIGLTEMMALFKILAGERFDSLDREKWEEIEGRLNLGPTPCEAGHPPMKAEVNEWKTCEELFADVVNAGLAGKTLLRAEAINVGEAGARVILSFSDGVIAEIEIGHDLESDFGLIVRPQN